MGAWCSRLADFWDFGALVGAIGKEFSLLLKFLVILTMRIISIGIGNDYLGL